MANKLTDAYVVKSDKETPAESAESVSITAVASTFGVDRDGEVVMPSAFSNGGLDNYTKNPVLLWAHNYQQAPIGKVTRIDASESGLIFDATFADHDEARKIGALYKGGFLNAFSIGFQPKAWNENKLFPNQTGRTYTDVELLEISAVPVPSNPDALVEARAKGLDTAPVEKALAAAAVAENSDGLKYNIKVMSRQLERALKHVDEITTDEQIKEGRVLSSRNRTLIRNCVDVMIDAVEQLRDLLSQTEDSDKSKAAVEETAPASDAAVTTESPSESEVAEAEQKTAEADNAELETELMEVLTARLQKTTAVAHALVTSLLHKEV